MHAIAFIAFLLLGSVMNMLDDSIFAKIKDQNEEFLRHSHHSKSHVERVYNLAIRISEKEKADLDVIKAAALLHDVARAMEDEETITDHAFEGAKIAREVLENVHFPREKVDQVIYCIEMHRFKKGAEAKTLEAKILQDADRLDIIGAIGLARVFTRGGWSNMPIHDPTIPPKEKYDGRSCTSVNHIYEKILKARDTINTGAAKEIAEERHAFVEAFLERLLKEWRGEI
ncbi:MAG: HD domain-containing protein [Candidatus Bathyarchaeota archaeon]|nr:MAG: HD domain-containing protein [Candidatus Bathyarchaeota archaeon]